MGGDAGVINVEIRVAAACEISRILAAYERWGYRRGVAPGDTVWLAEIVGELAGMVRIAPEYGTLVLRGMRIAEPWRRRGIGSGMLRVMAEWLGARECYCIPYAHLTGFYRQIGFVNIAPADAPPFLAERLAEYRRNGLDVTIMFRPGQR